MSKVAVVYWSGTGNTEKMAEFVAKGAVEAGFEVDSIQAVDFKEEACANYDAYAFGCPSMGAENLEECDFQPMWDSVKGSLGTKKVVLFGSYGWGSGEWMDDWKQDCSATLVDTFICNDEPDELSQVECFELGKKLA
ncbi:flavodoxin [Tannockella kyphosi]|uniref:flavodoxin n=1 Tax=Tannockella kyphosi TaxID=2899121 RepID=UPI0020118E65|nr:flavodoxin [Tannockella kyphosi]